MGKVKIKDEYIKLGQALKVSGMASSGIEAKIIIRSGRVTVNGEVEFQRGKKLHAGDVVCCDGESMKILQC